MLHSCGITLYLPSLIRHFEVKGCMSFKIIGCLITGGMINLQLFNSQQYLFYLIRLGLSLSLIDIYVKQVLFRIIFCLTAASYSV